MCGGSLELCRQEDGITAISFGTGSIIGLELTCSEAGWPESPSFHLSTPPHLPVAGIRSMGDHTSFSQGCSGTELRHSCLWDSSLPTEPCLKALQILSLSWLSFLDVFVSFEPCFEESEDLSRVPSAFTGTRGQIRCSFGVWGCLTGPQTCLLGKLVCSAIEQYPR